VGLGMRPKPPPSRGSTRQDKLVAKPGESNAFAECAEKLGRGHSRNVAPAQQVDEGANVGETIQDLSNTPNEKAEV
jgi:hypothetical protein